VRAPGLVDLFPLTEFAIEVCHFQRAEGDLVGLLGVVAVGAFDGAVELGRPWWKYEQAQATLISKEMLVMLGDRCYFRHWVYVFLVLGIWF
jgi:hypothetical protein